jgi:hypothetical protein
MTDGGVGPPIPSVTDDGWGVSQDPSVSVIRPRNPWTDDVLSVARIGPLWFFPTYENEKKKDLKIKTLLSFRGTDIWINPDIWRD